MGKQHRSTGGPVFGSKRNMHVCFLGDKLDDDMLDDGSNDDKKKSKAAMRVTHDDCKKAF